MIITPYRNEVTCSKLFKICDLKIPRLEEGLDLILINSSPKQGIPRHSVGTVSSHALMELSLNPTQRFWRSIGLFPNILISEHLPYIQYPLHRLSCGPQRPQIFWALILGSYSIFMIPEKLCLPDLSHGDLSLDENQYVCHALPRRHELVAANVLQLNCFQTQPVQHSPRRTAFCLASLLCRST